MTAPDARARGGYDDDRLTVEIYRWFPPRQHLLTVHARAKSLGRRIYGPKMVPGDGKLLVEFQVDRADLQAMLDLLPAKVTP